MYKGAKVQVNFNSQKEATKLPFVARACLFFVFNRLYFLFSFSISRESLKELKMERVEGGR
jgi:hypothetical protein